MKIENTSHITQALGQASATGRQAKAPPPPGHSGVAKAKARPPVKPPSAATLGAHAVGVRVSLSPTARSLGVGRNGSDFDAAKVKAVREAIHKGGFAVNAAVVAEKLLAGPLQDVLGAVQQEP